MVLLSATSTVVRDPVFCTSQTCMAWTLSQICTPVSYTHLDVYKRQAESTGKKVAIIGGGPGGLSAAYYLELMGHHAVVFEEKSKLGGMLRYGIPNYRFPRERLQEDIDTIPVSYTHLMKNNITLIGMPGSGKSTVGVVLAKRLGRRFVDSDLVIQERHGKLLHELITEHGVEGFWQIESNVNASLNLENSIIATGGRCV